MSPDQFAELSFQELNPPQTSSPKKSKGGSSNSSSSLYSIGSCLALSESVSRLVKPLESSLASSQSHELKVMYPQLIALILELEASVGYGGFRLLDKSVSTNSIIQPLLHDNNNSNNKSRKRRKGNDSAHVNRHQEIVFLESKLVVDQITKVLAMFKDSTLEFGLTLTTSVANLISTLCNELRENQTNQQQLELIQQNANVWLSSIYRHVSRCQSDKHQSNTDQANECLTSCYNAATSLICLVGTRLTKPCITSIVLLVDSAWSILLLGTEWQSMRTALAKFLASISLVGIDITGGTKVESGKLWCDALSSALSYMALLLNTSYPLKLYKNMDLAWTRDFPTIETCDLWLQTLNTTVALQKDRYRAVSDGARGLAEVIQELLGIATIHATSFPIEPALDVCELMLQFGHGAEQRLAQLSAIRADTSEQDKLLSVRSTLAIANQIKSIGHDLFCRVMTIVGHRNCQRYTKRLCDMVHTSLLQCSSTQMQDLCQGPKSSKTQVSFLNKSIIVRSKAVRSAAVAMTLLGPGSIVFMTRCFELLCGTALEVMVFGLEQDWSIREDALELAATTLDSLSSFCVTGSSFFPFGSRLLLERTVISCLEAVATQSIVPTIKVKLLKLCNQLLASPRPNGCCMGDDAVIICNIVSRVFINDSHTSVVSEARSLLQLAGAVAIPRAPPLTIERTVHEVSESSEKRVESFFSRILAARIQAENSETKQELPPEKRNTDHKSTQIDAEDIVVHEKPLLEDETMAELAEEVPNVNHPEPKQYDQESQSNLQTTSSQHEAESQTLISKSELLQKEVLKIHAASYKNPSDSESDDDDLPPITDCGPDEDDL